MSKRPGRPPGVILNGPEIRRIRVEVCGLSAAELGARVGLTEDVVWKAERSLPVMAINATRLARALGVKAGDITSPAEANVA